MLLRPSAIVARVRARFAPMLVLAAIGFTGCSGTGSAPSVAGPVAQQKGPSGLIHGGQQPISGSTVQMWAVGTAGDGSAATPLLDPAVITGANGSFNLTGLYTCPSASTLVYLTATGGDPGAGLFGYGNNSAIAMMAALGTCGSLSSSTYIYMNEVTTVGAVAALSPYMSSPTAIGSGGGDANALAQAFTTANELVDTRTGVAGNNLPAGYGVDTGLLYTVADILAACVNSDGRTGSTAPCGMLFNLTGGATTTNIADAALHIEKNPTSNLTGLWDIVTPNSPFGAPPLPPPSFLIAIEPKIPTPLITPNGGAFLASQNVTIADTMSGVTIYYTTDGSDPVSSASRSVFGNSGLQLTSSAKVRCIAVRDGYLNSDETFATFTAHTTQPLVSGKEVYGPNISFTDNGAGYTVTLEPITDSFEPNAYPSLAFHYTIDGSAPSASSTLYSGSFSVPVGTKVQAIGVVSGVTNSLPSVGIAGTPSPVILSLNFDQSGSTIIGSNFGSQPAYTGTSWYFSAINDSVGYQAGYGYDAVGIPVTSWTNTQVVLGTLSSLFDYGYAPNPGDTFYLQIWNPVTGVGPATCVIHITENDPICTHP